MIALPSPKGLLWLLVLLSASDVLGIAASSDVSVGLGIHDVTGPVGGINMNGYAMINQITQGLHTRLRARCYIFSSKAKGKDYGSQDDAQTEENRIVFCSIDAAMISSLVKSSVVTALQAHYGLDLYTDSNVMLSATHSHAAPGGTHDYLLYQITSLGFVKESAEDLITGIVGAIQRAHDSMKPSKLRIARGRLEDASRNRSPSAYLANPDELRERFQEDTDKLMTLMSISDADGSHGRGMISWFSVHCTSMNNTNPLISGDNKGYASWLMEQEMNVMYNNVSAKTYQPYLDPYLKDLAKKGNYYVASFAQTQEGDVSPNTEGAFCLDTGLPCDFATSTCPDGQGRPKNELCHGRGPGWKKGSEESTRIIGLRQYLKARSLVQAAVYEDDLVPDIDYEHAYIDMANATVKLADGSNVKTCSAARGFSFAAGTTDGPGALDFMQNDNTTGNAMWRFVRSFVSKPSTEQKKCHFPKPILLNSGEVNFPYAWEPRILPIQIYRIGTLLIIAVPAEFTTMAGRLLKEAVEKIFVDAGVIPEDQIVSVISGLSNHYSGYVTTKYEYGVQRYEGASTLYGPNTLDAYIQEFRRLALKMVSKKSDSSKPLEDLLPEVGHDPIIPPPDLSEKMVTFLPSVIFDMAPWGKSIGDVVPGADVRREYNYGDVVEATFYSGHPRNTARDPAVQLEGSFAYVEKYIGPSFDQVHDVVSQFVSDFSSRRLGIKSSLEYKIFGDESLNSLRVNISIPQPVKKYGLGVQSDESFSQTSLSQRAFNAREKPDDESFFVTLDKNKNIQISHEAPRLSQDACDLWQVIRDDDDWDVKFRWWKPVAGISAISYAKIEWKISQRPDIDVIRSNVLARSGVSKVMRLKYTEAAADIDLSGQYRLRYVGAHKPIFGQIARHEGVSSIFTIASGTKADDILLRK